MITGIGIDLFDISRMYDEIAAKGSGFQNEVFTPAELTDLQSCGGEVIDYAHRFAAKEAVLKALPADEVSPGFYWRDIEIRYSVQGKASAVLSSRLSDLLSIPENYKITLSFSNTSNTIMVCAVLEY